VSPTVWPAGVGPAPALLVQAQPAQLQHFRSASELLAQQVRPQRAPQWPCRCEAASAAAAAADYRQRRPADVRVLVVGATGYIGKYVVRELVRRGYDVVALARERSGIGGKASREDAQRVRPAACASPR